RRLRSPSRSRGRALGRPPASGAWPDAVTRVAGTGLGGGGRWMSGFHWDWAFAGSIMPQLAEGVVVTVIATALGSMLAFPLGLVWTFVRIARIRVVTPAVCFFVQFIRGTPLLIQLYFLFYVLPTWGLPIPPLATGIIGLGLFFSAYTTE